MRSHTFLLACAVLLGPTHIFQTTSGNKVENDLYLDEYGSGEVPDLGGPGGGDLMTYLDHEGSGHHGGSENTPYGAVYDNYDDTEDDYDDDPDYPGEDDDNFEGSGTKEVYIDVEEGDTIYRETEVIEEIIVEGSPDLKEAAPPPTTPPPTLTDTSDMDKTIQIQTSLKNERQVSIFAQPGILAAFIGGAVVGLLFAILLVMFIVYRMRKKDEGSYPLDEPKRMPLTSSYSPNDKEIYA